MVLPECLSVKICCILPSDSEANPASSPVVPASFNATSPVKLVGRTRPGLASRYRARFQASSFHLDSGNWTGDEAEANRDGADAEFPFPLCFSFSASFKNTEPMGKGWKIVFVLGLVSGPSLCIHHCSEI